MADESDIKKVREEEGRRGRRPKHPAEEEKLRRQRKLLLDSLQRGNSGLFKQLLIELDVKPGTARYDELLKMFDDYQRSKR
jgi:hypothetical protein